VSIRPSASLDMVKTAPRTPDGRYIVVRGRLWRTSNPNLEEDQRQALVDELMDARRAVKSAQSGSEEMEAARRRLDTAKRLLGERGQPWWTDGAPDFNRHLATNTPYAQWAASLEGRTRD
jgi:hypothetical protein